MSLFKNPAEIIAEAASTDLEMAASNSILTESAVDEFRAETSNIPTMDEGYMIYTEEVVPVFEYKGMAVVELDNLEKFMESAGLDSVTDALNALGEYYNLDPENIGVVIESDAELVEALEEAKKTTGFGLKTKKLGVMNQATKTLSDLKSMGVKLFKKPAKKKKSKRK